MEFRDSPAWWIPRRSSRNIPIPLGPIHRSAWAGSSRKVALRTFFEVDAGRPGEFPRDGGGTNIRTGEAAPIRSRRSPARATDPGRATTPVSAASCRSSSSSRFLPPARGTTTQTVLYHTLLRLTRSLSGGVFSCPVDLPEQTASSDPRFRDWSGDALDSQACTCFLDLLGI